MAEGQSTTITQAVEYRDVPGFPGYRAGTDGSIWSCRQFGGKVPLALRKFTSTWRKLKAYQTRRGYHFVLPHPLKKPRNVGHLVLLAFVGPRPDGYECCHNDGNPSNNALANLRWDTHAGNEADRVRHGTVLKGSQNGAAKLTEEAVRYIRAEYGKPGVSYATLARKFGVTKQAVGLILKRKKWAHLT